MTLLYAFISFLFGTLFASFAQLVASRLIQEETIGGRSHCPACGHPLRLLDVFPLLGFIINHGRCHFCNVRIPRIHWFVELFGGLLFALMYFVYGWTIPFAVGTIAIVVLLTTSITDLETHTVFDRVWIAGVIPLLGLRILDQTILAHLFASCLLFLVLYLLAFLGEKIMKRDALGGGDVKLFLFIGLVLTWDKGLLALFLASLGGFLFGILFRKKGEEMPLVPFLSMGVLIAYFVGSDIISWYLRLLGA